MELHLYNNLSEKNCIGKTLDAKKVFDGNLRNESSVINPVIYIEVDGKSLVGVFNYAYIPDFRRYYFITGIKNISTRVWELSLSVDVLESFKDSLMAQLVILSDSQLTGANNYIAGDQWLTNVKTTTEIIPFPSGLLESGEYILITAGG